MIILYLVLLSGFLVRCAVGSRSWAGWPGYEGMS